MKILTKMMILVFALLLMSGMTGVNLVQAAETTGETVQEIPEGYTPIYDVVDLYAIRSDLSGKYILMNDIDLSEVTSEGGDYDCGTGWDSIEEFSGILDGNGYRIIGMHIFGEFTDEAYIGLFEKLRRATIKNLGITDCNIDVDIKNSNANTTYTEYVGVLAGEMYYRCNIENCYTSGSIIVQGDKNTYYVGGLCGRAYCESYETMVISNCYNACDIDSLNAVGNYTGGLVGFYLDNYLSSASLQSSYSVGNVKGGCITTGTNMPTDGGLCGYIDDSVKIKNCDYLKGTAAQGIGNSADGADCVSLTEAQMKNSKIFTGFDFDTVWEIDPYCSYPYPQLKNNRMVRVSSVVLQTEPAKLVYNQGDKLEVSDAVLGITYEDDITTSIPVTTDMLSGYNMNEIGTQTVTVSYGGAETEFTIEVKEIPVASITIPETLSIYRSKTQQLTAIVLPENASDKTVTWESDNSTVASVNSNGLISAKARGTAIITATTANGLQAQCEVTVLVAAASVTLNSTSVTLKEGESTTLSAQILPLESTDTVEWMTSNANVAEVYEGNVVAKTAGVATITAYTESGAKAECIVTVQKVQTTPDTQNPGAPDTQNPSVSNPTQSDNTASIKKVQSVKAKIKSAKNLKKKSITLKLSGLSDCNGYQIQYGTKSNFKGAKTVKKSSNSVTLKKLKKGKKYYIRVRVYKKIAGKTYYGKWSSKKKVKITK